MEESDVEQVTLALLDSANDKDPVVREQVRKSILTLGKQQPNKVLSMCQDYLVKHPKLVVGHRVVILQTIELIVKTKIEDISYPKIKSIISLASDEMTRSKDVVPDWQQAASNILVAVGNKYINDIMEEILSKFQPGVLPHFFVVQTLASLSESNVYGMVPFLNAILGTMLPMLGMAKQDNMKWVFSSAYDILYCNWLQSRESKLRLTVAEAVGSMSHLMAHDKLEEQLPKLIPTILSLYKKNTEHYVISKSLCQVLDASVNMGSRVLETQIDSLLTTLHQQVCAPVDYSNPPTVKNHNEVLRCFSILANTFPDRLIMFVLQKLENSNERNRMGSLAVLRHLINSSTSIMESKKLLILASIRQPLADHSNKVKKRVVQVISAMAHHGYLELEGGDLLVKFIIQHCALPDTYYRPGQRPSDPEEVTNEALRSMCDNTLDLFTTTVGRLTDVLWPMLLYYLTPGQYSNATAPLCKSLTLLGTKKRAAQEPNFNIDFNEQVNLPSPHILMVRLLVNGSFPFRSRGHGAPSLSLLNVISPNIHPNTEALWEKEIPALLSYLEESTPETLDNKKWEESLLQLLAKSLVAIADDKWSCQLAIEATRYLSTYNQSLEEKSFLYRCIGVTLQHCYNKEVVQKQLQEILISARHNDAIERAGVAMGIGLCASSHLDATLAKLDDFGKSDAFRKASGIFSLLKDKNDMDVEKMKSTLILCYGYVALHAPEDQILSRIDSDILRSIRFYQGRTDGCHADSGSPPCDDDVCQPHVSFNSKRCATLTENDNFEMLRTCLNGVYGLPPLDTPDKDRGKDEEVLEPKQREALYKDTFNALQELLRNILARDLSPDGLQSVFKHIEAWLSSGQDHERERAMKTTAHILQFYFTSLNVKVSQKNNCKPFFPRAAIDCIYTLLYIQLRYEGFSLDYKDDSVERLITLRESMDNPDHSVLYKTCSELAKIISKRLPQQELNTLIFMLFEGLVSEMLEVLHIRLQMISEEQVKVSVAQSILILATQHLQTVINTLISYPLPFDSWSCEMWIALGADSNLASQIMEMLMEKLNVMVPYVDKKESMMRAGLTKVATSHPLAMTCALKEMMLNGQSQEAVVSLFPQLFSSLLIRLGSSVGVTLPKDINSNSIGTNRKSPTKLAAGFDVCGVAVEALRILLARAQLDDVVKPLDQEGAWDKMKDPQQHTTGGHGQARRPPSPGHSGVSVPLSQQHLRLMMMDVLMNNMMERISDPCCTVRMLAVRGLGNIAVGSPEKVHDGGRGGGVLFVSGLGNIAVRSPEKVHDGGRGGGVLFVSGLGNIAVRSPEKVNKYAKELLAAMSSGMEEKDDPGKRITLEAMSGLSKVLLYLDKKNVHLLVVYIFMKIKPFLES
ncbi:unnamed protein product, partial [Coregonus sp. 'balchen']